MDKILVADDDRNILDVIKVRLESKGYHVATAVEPEKAVLFAKDEVFDLALLDLRLDGKDGIELMGELHQINPEMPIIILTAYGTIETAVEAMKKGAYSYITKPFDGRNLLSQVDDCLQESRLSNELKRLTKLVKERYGFENIIGKSEKMKKVLEQVGQAAATDTSVYIEGESGTGKELIAKTLHAASSRKDGPFVAINCSAIPEALLESELFGYEKGAFTGADRSKQGFFTQAHKGTFFLDEISEMPSSMQVKLLRVLEEREFYPLGGSKTIKVDTRIIAASNKDLEAEVERSNFREDLFYRIYVIPIKLPSLSERKEDIPILSRYFLEKFSRKMQKPIRALSPSAIQKLMLYPWPGNVRELENTIEFAVAMATENVITEALILQTRKFQENGFKPLKDAKEDFERDYIIQLIEMTQGNVSHAAKLAGKYRADFYELLKKYDLKAADYRKE
jgi:two-component system response regulator GlrR